MLDGVYHVQTARLCMSSIVSHTTNLNFDSSDTHHRSFQLKSIICSILNTVSKPSSMSCLTWPQVSNFEDHAWLCGELVVPKKTSCSICVPRGPSGPRGQGTCLVTDKMGQSMFRTSRAAWLGKEDVDCWLQWANWGSRQLDVARKRGWPRSEVVQTADYFELGASSNRWIWCCVRQWSPQWYPRLS